VPPSGFENLFDPATLNTAMETLAKLGLAVLLGGLIGIERELTRRPAGVRTHMLVCLGCALFTEISQAFVSPSPDRVAAQVVTGIGFLGAGTILRTGIDVKGLTTAASIWTVAAIGMAISLGGPFFWVAIVATLLTFGTLKLVAVIEDRILQVDDHHTLTMTLDSRETLGKAIGIVEESGCGVKRLEVERTDEGFAVKAAVRGDASQVIARLSALQGVRATALDDAR
jgi:putative Mg2+ transporter-C (MgtC) family protein